MTFSRRLIAYVAGVLVLSFIRLRVPFIENDGRILSSGSDYVRRSEDHVHSPPRASEGRKTKSGRELGSPVTATGIAPGAGNSGAGDVSSTGSRRPAGAGAAAAWVTASSNRTGENQTAGTSGTADDRRDDPKTVALIEPFLKGGFRNQAMRFTALVLHAVRNNITQILLPSVRWGDRFGTDRPVPHEDLFDVEHWNSFHASGLPLLVPYDPTQHYEWNATYARDRTAMENPIPRIRGRSQFLVRNPRHNATHPYGHGGGNNAGWLWFEFKQYTEERRKDPALPRSPVEALMFRALRPSAQLHAVMDRGLSASVRRGDFMTVHPRIEPDMQAHPACAKPRVYVRSLSRIFDMVEERFGGRNATVPPASEVFLPVNRAMLEEGARPESANGTVPAAAGTRFHRAMAIRNLEALNRALSRGLWNGRARVFEFGGALRDDPAYDGMCEIAASVVNFFLAVRGKIFAGTQVSSWSVDAWAVRHHTRGPEAANYNILPRGLQLLNGTDPVPHYC